MERDFVLKLSQSESIWPHHTVPLGGWALLFGPLHGGVMAASLRADLFDGSIIGQSSLENIRL